MSDETQAALHLDNAVISVQFVSGAVMSAMGWWIKRQDTKLSKIEADLATKVSMEIYNATLESLRNDIREQSRETRERIDRLLTILIEKK